MDGGASLVSFLGTRSNGVRAHAAHTGRWDDMPKGIAWLPPYAEAIGDDIGPDCPRHGEVWWWCNDRTDATAAVHNGKHDLGDGKHDHAHRGLMLANSWLPNWNEPVGQCPVDHRLYTYHKAHDSEQ